VGNNPQAIAINASGLAYVCNYNDNTLSVIDTSTNSVVGTPIVASNPVAIAANADGSVLICTGAGVVRLSGYVAGSLSANNWSNNAPITAVSGSSAGHYYWSQPENGTGYKKVIVTLAALTDRGGGTIFFSTPFVYTPGIFSSVDAATQALAAGSTVTTGTLQLGASTAATGTITVEGF
jgi:YVTN family beta-propeller protein